MDGNGRWAAQKGLPRLMGHREGVQALVRTVRALADRGVAVLTVYAFSTENWSRPEEEVSGLMGLVPTAMKAHLQQLAKQGVRVRAVGDLGSLSEGVRKAFEHMAEVTQDNQRIRLNVAFNYGGRWDLVQATRRALAAGVDPQALSEKALAPFLALSPDPDPDLLIRTGGELRLSNFLLWQLAYAELHFSARLWPEFGEADVDEALRAYAARERRFGALAPAEGISAPQDAGPC